MLLLLLAVFSSLIVYFSNRQRWYGLHWKGLGRRNDSAKRKRVVRETSSLQRHSAPVWNRTAHGVHDILIGKQNDRWDSEISKRDEGQKDKGEERAGLFLLKVLSALFTKIPVGQPIAGSKLANWYSGFLMRSLRNSDKNTMNPLCDCV